MWNSIFQLLILLAPVWLTEQVPADVKLLELYAWKFPDFAFEDQQKREAAINNEQFIAENVVILDSDYYAVPNQPGRFFATTPAVLMKGYPATLSVVIQPKKEDPPLLQPFPNWKANDKSSCEGLISVFRIQIDQCGRLWALDSGMIDVFVSEKHPCLPKLIIYDLTKADGTEVLRHEFDENAINPKSALLNLVIESTANDCSDSVAYISDVQGFGLTIFNMKDRTSYRVDHPRFYPDPDYGIITSNGITFNLMDGIFGLALSPPNENPRTLYWQCLASVVDSWVSTAIIKDKNAITNTDIMNKEIHTTDPLRDGQGTVMVMTQNGIIIFALANKNALYCWNIAKLRANEKPYLLFQDDENFQFIAGMKLHGSELIITSTKLQKFSVGAMVKDEIKYRILSIANVDDLLKGTDCLLT